MLAGVLALALTACAGGGPERTTTIDQARSQAIGTLRSVLALRPDLWPQDVPKPVANDCRLDGQRAVQFSYYVEVDAPSDPGALVRQAGEHWERQGYELSKTRVEMDAATGTVFAVVARGKGKPRASMTATRIRAHVNVDSLCVAGDPDEYR